VVDDRSFVDVDDSAVDDGVACERSNIPLADRRPESIATRDTGPVIVEGLRCETWDHALSDDDVVTQEAARPSVLTRSLVGEHQLVISRTNDRL
jgi:hypothetical protein